MDYFLEGTKFQVGSGVENRALDQLASVLDKEVRNTADGGLSQTYCLGQARMNCITRVSNCRPRRNYDGLRGEIFNVGVGVEYQALDKV